MRKTNTMTGQSDGELEVERDFRSLNRVVRKVSLSRRHELRLKAKKQILYGKIQSDLFMPCGLFSKDDTMANDLNQICTFSSKAPNAFHQSDHLQKEPKKVWHRMICH